MRPLKKTHKKPILPKGINTKEEERIKQEFKLDMMNKQKKKYKVNTIGYASA